MSEFELGDPKELPLVGPPLFYYSPTFRNLMEAHRLEVSERLVGPAKRLRDKYLIPSLRSKLDRYQAWEISRGYLDQIEGAIARLVEQHSTIFWMHLYRRIAPRLAEVHGSNRDNVTVRLVREFAELAFAKHGADRAGELGTVGRIKIHELLDGRFYPDMADHLGSKLRTRKYFEAMRRDHGVVMRTFAVSDFLNVFEIEGLCYEYWRTTASMRSIGKGSGVTWDDGNDWFEYDEAVPSILFALHDLRIGSGEGLETRLGTWTAFDNDRPHKEQIHIAQYNANPRPSDYATWDQEHDRPARGVAMQNFSLGRISLIDFEATTSFMAEAFSRRHGVALHAILACVWALCFLGFFTSKMITAPTKRARIGSAFKNQTNLLFRGYTMNGLPHQELAKDCRYLAETLGYADVPDEDEMARALHFLTLTPESRQQIALWARGRHSIVVRDAEIGAMIDLVAVAPLLHGLFYGLRDEAGEKGVVFEDSFRNALGQNQIDVVFAGEIHWPHGIKREVDAAVRVSDRLVLFECVSIDMPVDTELSKPRVFDERKRRLEEKLHQAKSLAEQVRSNPVARNVDFSWARVVEWRVVSPFLEFTWDLGDHFFDDHSVVRLMSAWEAIQYLRDEALPGAKLIKVLQGERAKPAIA